MVFEKPIRFYYSTAMIKKQRNPPFILSDNNEKYYNNKFLCVILKNIIKYLLNNFKFLEKIGRG
jgi:hypothetical protein